VGLLLLLLLLVLLLLAMLLLLRLLLLGLRRACTAGHEGLQALDEGNKKVFVIDAEGHLLGGHWLAYWGMNRLKPLGPGDTAIACTILVTGPSAACGGWRRHSGRGRSRLLQRPLRRRRGCWWGFAHKVEVVGSRHRLTLAHNLAQRHSLVLQHPSSIYQRLL